MTRPLLLEYQYILETSHKSDVVCYALPLRLNTEPNDMGYVHTNNGVQGRLTLPTVCGWKGLQQCCLKDYLAN
jgi:hypothetical protein